MLEKLTWQDWVKKLDEFHITHLKSDSRWTIHQTATELGRSIGSACQDLQLASWMKSHPEILQLKNKVEALQFIKAKKLKLRMR